MAKFNISLPACLHRHPVGPDTDEGIRHRRDIILRGRSMILLRPEGLRVGTRIE
jgi:hypothetical protein